MASLSTRPLPEGSESYQSRRQRAYERVEALGLKRRWIAEQVGRSVRCVTEVLRGTDTGGPTLVRIEVLLLQVDRGEVEVPAGAGTEPKADGPGVDQPGADR